MMLPRGCQGHVIRQDAAFELIPAPSDWQAMREQSEILEVVEAKLRWL